MWDFAVGKKHEGGPAESNPLALEGMVDSLYSFGDFLGSVVLLAVRLALVKMGPAQPVLSIGYKKL